MDGRDLTLFDHTYNSFEDDDDDDDDYGSSCCR